MNDQLIYFLISTFDINSIGALSSRASKLFGFIVPDTLDDNNGSEYLIIRDFLAESLMSNILHSSLHMTLKHIKYRSEI